jgi:DNA-binding MarR family transcriptional regulator
MKDKKFELIRQLIDKVADYESHCGATASFSVSDFADFLHKSGVNLPKKRVLAGDLEPEMQAQGDRRETSIAILVTFMHRYAKLHARKIFTGSKISGMDDFSYLIVLVTHDRISKTELIRKNVHEKATGMEIIKRLLNDKLVKQFDATEDKRSKLISITPAGKEAVFKILHQLEGLSTLITADLTEQEKHQLQRILLKLDEFHYDIYLNDKDSSVPDLIARKLNPKR